MIGFGGIWRRNGHPVSPADWSALSVTHGPIAQSSPQPELALWSTAQPEAGVWISGGGRIDNREELARRLNRPCGSPTEDAALVLAAYLAYGHDCPQHLIGDFAFAIWDERHQHWFCARDVFGVYPFYYVQVGALWAAASELTPLLYLPEVPRRLNEAKIVDFMLEMFEDKQRTFFTDIQRLPPACSLVVTRTDLTVHRYFEFNPNYELRLGQDADYAEAYREAFVEAVRCRMLASKQIGSTLSGGLDSSSVASVAAALLAGDGRRLPTVSAVFDTVPSCDEREFMRAVIDAYLCEAQLVPGDQVNPVSEMLAAMAGEPEPYYAPQMFVNRALWKRAGQVGVDVLLEGLFGDNIVSHGYHWLTELGNRWRWTELYRQYHQLASRHPDPQPAAQFMLRAFGRDGIKPYLPKPLVRGLRWVRRLPLDEQVSVPAYFNPDFARRLGIAERLQEQAALARSLRTARQQHLLDLEHGLITSGLEVYAVQAGKFDIEPRFPFLDRRLAELCLAIPASQKLHNGYSRDVARRGLAQYLPDQIRLRPGKGNLSGNFIRGMQADASLIAEVLAQASPEAQTFFNMEYLSRKAAQAGAGRLSESDFMYVFSSIALIAWLSSGGVRNTLPASSLPLVAAEQAAAGAALD